MLELKDIHARYDQLTVLKGININIKEGEIISLLGANGAGKTSILKTITGGITITSGNVFYKEEKITSLPGFAVARKGISHVPENRRVFKDLNVEENLIIGGMKHTNKKELMKRIDTIYKLFPRLQERKKQLAGTMSGGEQQMLAIGRGIMMEPKLLILDEPSQGLAPKIVEEIFSSIKRLGEAGRTVILVEQNIFQALKISHRGYIVKNGQIIKEGIASDLLKDEEVREAYLH
ncbi:ABC transporter ATP-binding protein [Bacillus sp. Marseille-P3661]|uniref:ABC transporter ATP-binding protein n=1 Tax=Bacillus sp. Marseille-P3661 TaxID=1936234 RepID=UPI000C829FCC|nr:ABC transporter ATP-binding protein [Bacillus sp. Marseille-P3661]